MQCDNVACFFPMSIIFCEFYSVLMTPYDFPVIASDLSVSIHINKFFVIAEMKKLS